MMRTEDVYKRQTQNILRMTGRSAKFPMVCALSLLLFLVGAAFALTLGNLFQMCIRDRASSTRCWLPLKQGAIPQRWKT